MLDDVAILHDGQTARPRRVAVTVEGAHLNISTTANPPSVLYRWPLSTLILVKMPYAKKAARISSSEMPFARLDLPDRALFYQIQELAAGLSDRRASLDFWRAVGISAACAAGLGAVMLAVPYLAGALAPLVPKTLLDQAAQASISRLGYFADWCTTEESLQPLQTLVDDFGAAAGAESSMTVQVLDTSMVNALALPGGELVVFRGLIDKAETADEVAGVLAHEVAHAVHRHPAQRLVEILGFQIFIATFTGSGMGGFVSQLSSMAYSRRLEAEADDMAIELLTRERISSVGLADFFRRLSIDEADPKPAEDITSEEARAGLGSLLSTHPATADRAAKAEAAAHRISNPRSALSKEDWERVRSVCETVDDAQDGR